MKGRGEVEMKMGCTKVDKGRETGRDKDMIGNGRGTGG